MHLHILGICGTFMGGVARLAVEKGFRVTGSDKHCYPPMSSQLESLGIELYQGYDADQLKLADDSQADCVIVGNALSRGVEVVEALLNSNQIYRSGPQWLSENILQEKWVIAVAGTHGKTSTASMITWILEACGYQPGFLIGGVMENFGVSARLTESPFFVVEADEYDTAFFDKRSKFVHYHARTCVLNNLEFDHADIFTDLAAIENQFHHLVRTVAGNGLIIRPDKSEALQRVLERGCWTEQQSFASENNASSDWQALRQQVDGSEFDVLYKGEAQGRVSWSLIGEHNVNNALAAIAAARHVGVNCKDAIEALASFKNVKRRMELKGCVKGIEVYDDFAHHPTAIASTLQGLLASKTDSRVIAVVDPCSNTMKMGIHKDTLLSSVKGAGLAVFHMPDSIDWQIEQEQSAQIVVLKTPRTIIELLVEQAQPGDSILVMSNGGFAGIHEKLLAALAKKWSTD